MSERRAPAVAVMGLLVLALWLSSPQRGAGIPSGQRPALAGLSLTAALQLLQREGLQVFFTSQLVRPEMRVEREPSGTSQRAALDELLAPHRLTIEERVGGRLVVVPAPPRSVSTARSAGTATPAAPAGDHFAAEIDVTPVAGDAGRPGAVVLDGADLETLPHPAVDPLRALAVLPSTAMGEASSRVQVRGAREGEVLVLLDGLELLAPYHLQDYDSALSIIAPAVLEHAELLPDGYSAAYGDRMGGVLDLTTTTPVRQSSFAIGASELHGELAGSGRFASDRGSWYLTGRTGAYHEVLELYGQEGSPRFWDSFGKADLLLGPAHTLRLSALQAGDDLELGPFDVGNRAYESSWGNDYAWLTHVGLLRPDLLVETLASVGEIERERSGHVDLPGRRFEIDDVRTMTLFGAKQRYSYERSGRLSVEAGLDLRQLASRIQYQNERQLDGALAPLRDRPATGTTQFDERFEFNQAAAFVTTRVRLFSTLTAEVGLRHDWDSLTSEGDTSPRVNLVWNPRPASTVRLAWGEFHQTQRPYELQVEDDERGFEPPELGEHRVLGVEHRLSGGTTFRIEAFEQRQHRLRPRYTNLFDPITLFPELEEDRVRLDPARARSLGAEVGVRGPESATLRWWMAAAWSRARQEIDGTDVPTANDQPYSAHLGASYRLGRGWELGAVWLYHTGWPTTAVSAIAAPGGDATSPRPLLGPLYGERLSDYHRLDVRLGRAWTLWGGTLSAHLDLQNLYDHRNARGFTGFRFAGEAGAPRLEAETVTWAGIVPSIGVRFEH